MFEDCPFCGSKAIALKRLKIKSYYSDISPWYVVVCCDCWARGGKSKNKELAVMNWNIRLTNEEFTSARKPWRKETVT